MKKLVCFSVMVVVLGFTFVGCEWSGTSSEDSWSDNYSWINFSGLYRGSGGLIVREFSATGSVPTSPDGSSQIEEVVVTGERGDDLPRLATAVSGRLVHRPGIVPGSVTIVIQGQGTSAEANVTDDGSGGLSGFQSLTGPDPSQSRPVNGTINYTTGVWTLHFEDPGLRSPGMVFANYSYDRRVAVVDGGAADAGLRIAGGSVNSIQVEQLGNKLTFHLSSGHVLSGRLSVATLPGGDTTGRSGGDVSATYEVSGDVGGETVRISGTLSGVYVPPADIQFVNAAAPIISGILSNRILQGIWMQSSGTADVYGVAPQQSVPVNVGDFQPIVAEDTQTTTQPAGQQ